MLVVVVRLAVVGLGVFVMLVWLVVVVLCCPVVVLVGLFVVVVGMVLATFRLRMLVVVVVVVVRDAVASVAIANQSDRVAWLVVVFWLRGVCGLLVDVGIG